MTPRRVGAAFVFIMAALFAQFILARWVYEPYPALVMPAGGTLVDESQGYIEATRFEVFVGTTPEDPGREIDAHRLLAMLPSQYRGRMLDKCLGLQDCKDGFFQPPSPEHARQGRQWLLRRLDELEPGLEPGWLEVRRVRLKISLEPGAAVERTVLSVDRIPLEVQ